MVTGLQLVTGGDVQAGGSRSVHRAFGGGVDVGALAGGPPGMAVANAEVSGGNHDEAKNNYGFDDKRV